MDNIVIGIPTFKRPVGLTALLASIGELNCSGNITVLVADNEGENGQGTLVVSRIQDSFKFPLKVIPVPERGISSVRNALLNHAFEVQHADFIAMVDDDEEVDKNWLHELIKIQKQTAADVVGGYVLPKFETEPPEWVEGLPLYWRTKHDNGDIDLIEGTTSVLLSKSVWERYDKQNFDLAFGLTGGGDKDYFIRLKQKGATFAFAQKSVSYELFGESRLTEEWAKSRALRIGSGDMRIIKSRLNSPWLMSKEIVKLFMGLVVFSSMRYFSLSKTKRFHALLKQQRQIGKIKGLWGAPLVDTYKKIHGN